MAMLIDEAEIETTQVKVQEIMLVMVAMVADLVQLLDENLQKFLQT